MKDTVNIGFVGNPNCGKTTLFNAYTGAKLKVANWPGVTVEKKEGSMQYHGHTFKLVDLPGIYSLTSYTMEEKVSREFILSDDVDVITISAPFCFLFNTVICVPVVSPRASKRRSTGSSNPDTSTT